METTEGKEKMKAMQTASSELINSTEKNLIEKSNVEVS